MTAAAAMTVKSSPAPLTLPAPPARFTSSVSGAALGVGLILFGCCANVLSLELLTRHDASLGNLITFSQFLFIAVQGLSMAMDWSTLSLAKRELPLSVYVKLTTIFFVVSVMNNKALDYDISVPVHTVFRSSGLTATLALGRWLYGHRYSVHQIIACILVTGGIIVVTLADAMKKRLKDCCNADTLTSTTTNITMIATMLNDPLSVMDSIRVNWCIGIVMLTTALFLSAYLGHEQDRAYKRYGKHTWKELMLYSHLFALPGFLIVGRDIVSHFLSLLSSPHATIMTVPVPMWLVLVANLALQAVCIRGVYLLTTHTNTLTCNLVITARKLLSLLLSVVWFTNVFTAWHWLGSMLVFCGVVCYSWKPRQLMQSAQASPVSQSPAIRSPRNSNTAVNGKAEGGASNGEVDDNGGADANEPVGVRKRRSHTRPRAGSSASVGAVRSQ